MCPANGAERRGYAGQLLDLAEDQEGLELRDLVSMGTWLNQPGIHAFLL